MIIFQIHEATKSSCIISINLLIGTVNNKYLHACITKLQHRNKVIQATTYLLILDLYTFRIDLLGWWVIKGIQKNWKMLLQKIVIALDYEVDFPQPKRNSEFANCNAQFTSVFLIFKRKP